MRDPWLRDAEPATEYHAVSVQPKRSFILRMTTGADLWMALQRFAIDRRIRFAKIHAAFMGGLQPARFLVWVPDTTDRQNWHHEEPMKVDNLSMILAMGGMIHPRQIDGNEQPFPAIHFVAGGAWNVPTVGGHLLEGSIVKGAFEVFVTEIGGIDVIYGPPDPNNFPENWYREIEQTEKEQ